MLLCSRHPVPSLLLIELGIAGAKVILALTLVAPVVWGDSALYLSRARNLAQFGWPIIDNFCGPDYPPPL